jgi:tetratricopeptide (TPR) repeat protein
MLLPLPLPCCSARASPELTHRAFTGAGEPKAGQGVGAEAKNAGKSAGGHVLSASGAMDAKSQVLLQCQTLNGQGLYSSSATLLSFLLSPDTQDPNVYMAYGDALFNMGEYKRAEAALRTALELLGGAPEAPEAVQLRWKIAECFGRENNYSLQLYALTGIPAQARTPQVNMALGRLYQRFGSQNDALACFREALSSSPLAVEAVEELAQLGEKEQDILNLVGKSVGNQRWLLTLVAARVQQAVSDHRAAAASYAHLAEAFPDNGEVMCNLAVCHAHTGNVQASLEAFAQVRARDEHYMDHMDCYAEMLKTTGASAPLNQVCSACLRALMAMLPPK